MALTPGTRLGVYEVTAQIGEGGMGQVYRATDTKLKRQVAIKILPPSLAADHDRLARFQREAEVLASLNHPNIAAIHGLEESGGMTALVMELVVGDDLAQRIARGAIPLDDALPIAKQIAEALEAAHEQGIIHRDLKPANIKVRADGTVKVLDFGLAKAMEPVGAAAASASMSPTLSLHATQAGMILGTAEYMSPEQARGKTVDKRADIWAFGCLLYEMLTGRRTFPTGETVSDTIAGILTREPDWQTLPAATPPKVRALLERCLRKDARRRLPDIAEARIEIEEAASEHPEPVRLTPPLPRAKREYVLGALVAVLLLTTVGLAVRSFFAPAPNAPAVRFEVALPSANLGTPDPSVLSLSPDGRTLAFITILENLRQIWVRPLDSAVAQPLSSTEGLTTSSTLFWSPDSQYIGFLTQGKLNKVAAMGGPSQVLANLPAGNYAGATWNAEGVILVGRSGLSRGPLLRVSATGGEPTPVTELDASRQETRHAFPSFLPDGRHFLYVADSSASNRAAYVGALDSKERHPLAGIASEVKYSSNGLVVFLREGSLMAQLFDVQRLELSGEAFPVAELGTNPNALGGPFTVSATGALAYMAPASADSQGTQLAWFDRKGGQVGLVGPRGEYLRPSLSPDGKFVAFQRGAPADIWYLDIEKSVTSRLVSHSAADLFPVWSPDGQSVVFVSNRDGPGVYERAFGVVGEEKLVLKTEVPLGPTDWSRDGNYIAFNETTGGPYDLWALPLSGDRKLMRLTESPFNEVGARISPDGRWIAYMSSESPGPRYQLYIQSFPKPGKKSQVSTNGAYIPRWSRDGRELFYVAPDLTLTAVSITSNGSSLEVGAPVPLFKVPINRATIGNSRDYDVAADGRFLVNVSPPSDPAPVTVILNWQAALGARERR